MFSNFRSFVIRILNLREVKPTRLAKNLAVGITKHTKKEKCMELLFKEENYKIMGACFEVYKEMGCGFLESVYQECLELEFSLQV